MVIFQNSENFDYLKYVVPITNNWIICFARHYMHVIYHDKYTRGAHKSRHALIRVIRLPCYALKMHSICIRVDVICMRASNRADQFVSNSFIVCLPTLKHFAHSIRSSLVKSKKKLKYVVLISPSCAVISTSALQKLVTVKRNYAPINNDGSPTMASRIVGKHTGERRERDHGNLNKLTEPKRIRGTFTELKKRKEYSNKFRVRAG